MPFHCRLAERLDAGGMGRQLGVEPTDLTLKGLEKALVNKALEDGGSAVGLIEQGLTADLTAIHRKERAKHLQLARRTAQQSESHVEGCRRAEFLSDSDKDLCLGAVAGLSLKTGRQRCLHHIANGRHVIVGNPLPQPQLWIEDNGSIVEQRQRIFHLFVGELWRVVVDAYGKSRVSLGLAKGHQHAHAYPATRHQSVRQPIGKRTVQGYRQNHIHVFHILQSYRFDDTVSRYTVIMQRRASLWYHYCNKTLP